MAINSHAYWLDKIPRLIQTIFPNALFLCHFTICTTFMTLLIISLSLFLLLLLRIIFNFCLLTMKSPTSTQQNDEKINYDLFLRNSSKRSQYDRNSQTITTVTWIWSIDSIASLNINWVTILFLFLVLVRYGMDFRNTYIFENELTREVVYKINAKVRRKVRKCEASLGFCERESKGRVKQCEDKF